LKLLFVFGTRPEAIKLAPLINLALGDSRFEVRICVTGQHREMLQQVLWLFGITPDFDLRLMKANQTLTDITCGVLKGLGDVLDQWTPDRIVVHGDTTTTFAASLAAFYRRIGVVHVEAGLRTGDLNAPWPEELNRKLTAAIAMQHFAPTQAARANLLAENVPDETIAVVGNTVVDAVTIVADRVRNDLELLEKFKTEFSFLQDEARLILVTGHRRENFGDGMLQLCAALAELAKKENVQVVFPVHLNPNVRSVVQAQLAGIVNIFLLDPLEYSSFVYLMTRAHHIITDSGGIQEEAVTLRKPVLITREVTERPEAITSDGTNLVGMNAGRIVEASARLLDSSDYYDSIAGHSNPFGDGTSSQQILNVLVAGAGV
jgi:UDP-N-acetylglucosamine 2-epimerase (non-hydrolysing)